MKSRPVTPVRAISLLRHHSLIPINTILEYTPVNVDMDNYVHPNKQSTLLIHAKHFLHDGYEIMLTSGAKLYYNENLKGNWKNEPYRANYSGWFIIGYADNNWDVDCYFDKALHNKLVKEGRLNSREV